MKKYNNCEKIEYTLKEDFTIENDLTKSNLFFKFYYDNFKTYSLDNLSIASVLSSRIDSKWDMQYYLFAFKVMISSDCSKMIIHLTDNFKRDGKKHLVKYIDPNIKVKPSMVYKATKHNGKLVDIEEFYKKINLGKLNYGNYLFKEHLIENYGTEISKVDLEKEIAMLIAASKDADHPITFEIIKAFLEKYNFELRRYVLNSKDRKNIEKLKKQQLKYNDKKLFEIRRN